jgi:hypothetical protein
VRGLGQQALEITGRKYAIITIAVINLLILMYEVRSTKNRIGWLVSETILHELSSSYQVDLIDFCSQSNRESIHHGLSGPPLKIHAVSCVAD